MINDTTNQVPACSRAASAGNGRNRLAIGTGTPAVTGVMPVAG